MGDGLKIHLWEDTCVAIYPFVFNTQIFLGLQCWKLPLFLLFLYPPLIPHLGIFTFAEISWIKKLWNFNFVVESDSTVAIS